MKRADVIVVGGGPAGSITALLLARAGFSVDLLERRAFPRAKPCGDCVSPGANALLRRIGVWHDVMAARPALLDGWLLAADGEGFSARFQDDAVSLALPREKLDAVLVEAAARAGVHVRTGVSITNVSRSADGAVNGVLALVDGQARAFEARLTVGADGLRSRVARRLGAYRRMPIVRKVSLTTHLHGVPAVSTLGEMHVRNGVCLGIARVSADTDLCNVTLVVPSAAAQKGVPHQMMRKWLRCFAERDLSELIHDDAVILASGPFDWRTREIVFPGAALVGDAAGYFDPFTGQGIFQALAGAEMLAGHAADFLGGDAHALSAYRQRHRAMMRPARRVQRAIDFVCARPRLARRVFGALARTPEMAARIVAVTGDTRPARDLISPFALARLLLPQ